MFFAFQHIQYPHGNNVSKFCPQCHSVYARIFALAIWVGRQDTVPSSPPPTVPLLDPLKHT